MHWADELIVVIAGMLASCAGANAQSTTTKAATGSQNTATVQRGNLTATVNAAGNITAHQQVALNFGQAGTVQKVNVRAGDRVTAGQVLTQLDTSDLQLQLENAKVNLKIAQNKLAQTKAPSTEQGIANARSRLESAQAGYNKLAAGPTKTDLNRPGRSRQHTSVLRRGCEVGGHFRHHDRRGDNAVSEVDRCLADRRRPPTTRWPPRRISAPDRINCSPERDDRLQSGQSQLRGIAGDFGIECQIQGRAGALVASAGAGEPGETPGQRQ